MSGRNPQKLCRERPAGRGWGEVSGDRLAEIETWARDTLSVATISRSRDVLALVEIAKAARGVMYAEFENADEVLVPKDDFDALRSALASMDVSKGQYGP